MVRDLYYPHVGLENHLRGHYQHRVGVYVEGELHWLSDDGWEIAMTASDTSLKGTTIAHHAGIGVTLTFNDTIAEGHNAFLRHVIVANTLDRSREIKLYFAHQFEIQKMHGSDTAYFDPHSHSIIHYKGRRVFLINGSLEGESFNDFATGRAHFQGKDGTHRDAEDGILSKNPIEHGPADSAIGFSAPYAGKQERVCEYWLVAALSIREAIETNAYLLHKTPERVRLETESTWHEWMRHMERDFADLSEPHISLYKKSLMFARAHADIGGGIIASLDSDMFQYGLDTYSYVWTRDSAYVVLALGYAGDWNYARLFFEFCKEVITEEGYFMHKYQPDKALGSSWHPWIVNGKTQLPIQEDETAIVIYALNEYMQHSRNIAFLEMVYPQLVEAPAQFLMSYRDTTTHLPQPSYDLWERKRGTSTYTSATVFGALKAAAELARLLGRDDDVHAYEKAAEEVHHGILAHLWSHEKGVFYNMISTNDGAESSDATIDISSAYGIFLFNVLPPKEMRLLRAFETSVRRLSEGVQVTGIARFEDDDYYRVPGPSTGNPWFLTTLWYAEYLIASATSLEELARVRDIFSWTVRYALSTGALSEQLDPRTGDQICAGPLAWTHAAYVRAVQKYLDRYEILRSSKASNA